MKGLKDKLQELSVNDKLIIEAGGPKLQIKVASTAHTIVGKKYSQKSMIAIDPATLSVMKINVVTRIS